MAHKLDGYVADLAALPIAGLSNGDTADVWLGNARIKMVFDSTSTNATAVTPGQAIPYSQRPDDYGAGPGVWVEDVGAYQLERLNGGQVITGVLRSNYWEDGVAGAKFDLDNELLAILDDTFGNAGVQIGWISGAAKIYAGDGANKFIQFDGTNLTWKGSNSELNSAGNIIATGGSIGGWTMGANSLTSGYIGLHSNGYAEGAEILLGHATAYASAKIGLKADGSGKLANGNISWTAAGVASFSGAISASTLDIGGSDATSFHVDVDGNVWAGAASYNIATNPFAVSNAGAMRAGGFSINATDGIYSGSGATRVQMKPGVGFWTGATAQADALNYLDVDGSGWLADGNISWTAAGVLTARVNDGGDLTINQGADIILEGGVIGDPSILWITGAEATKAPGELRFFTTISRYTQMYLEEDLDGRTAAYLHLLPGASLKSYYTSGVRLKIGSASQEWDLIDLYGDINIYGKINLVNDSMEVDTGTTIGLGEAKGRIEFDDTTVDEINFLDCNVGIGTSTPNSLLELGFITENLELVDAGSSGATEQDWIEVEVGGVQGYIRVYASK